MTSTNWKIIWDLFRRASELPEAQQELYLAAAAPSAEILERVRQLLADEAAASADEPEDPKLPFETIGPYRLVEAIGEGSMGSVFRAEQDRPLRRTVALKLVRPGLRSKEVIARFEIERRALAMMDHPNIARVYDAGQTVTGQPFFAMEFVDGIRITRYCRQHELSIRERLKLLIPVCSAIQHAHQKGIIHRDIKPSNVLVTEVDGRPVVKVIDFGVARAVESTERGTLFTHFGSVVGTVTYMSPEQATVNASGVDTRSDIYSTGVLAYKLLTGSAPFEGGNIATALEQLRTQDPLPPSKRGLELDNEIDWIVMKAIDKDPSRRYQTMSALAVDIQRYLDGEPVEAGPPSRTYRMQKFARRYHKWIATAAAFLAVLVGATAVSVRQAIRATEAERAALVERDKARLAEQEARSERDRALKAEAKAREQQLLATEQRARADAESQTARAVDEFLRNDVLAQASPNVQAGKPDPNLTVRAALDRAASELEKKLAKQPLVRASIEHTIATSYLDLGLYAQARAHSAKAIELRTALLGANHPETLLSVDRHAAARLGLAEYEEAHTLWSSILVTQKRVVGAEHPDTLRTLQQIALVYRSQGKYPDAEKLLVGVLEAQRRTAGEQNPATIQTAGKLGSVYLMMGKHAEAEKLQRFVYEARRKQLGEDHPETLESMHDLAKALHYLSRLPEAERLYRGAIEGQKRILGEGHALTRTSMDSLASCLARMGRLEEAFTLRREVLALQQRYSGDRHPATLTAMHNLAGVLDGLGEHERAIALYEQTMGTQRAVLGQESPQVLLTMYNLARSEQKLGRFEQAAALLERVVETRRRVLGPSHPAIQQARTALAAVYADMGRIPEALDMATDAWAIRRARFGENHFQTADAADARALALASAARFAEAREMAASALAVLAKHGADHPDALDVRERLAVIEMRAGNSSGAGALLQAVLETRLRKAGVANRATRRTAVELAMVRHRLGEKAEAERLARMALTSEEAGWEMFAAENLLRALSGRQRSSGVLPAAMWRSVPVLVRLELADIVRSSEAALAITR